MTQLIFKAVTLPLTITRHVVDKLSNLFSLEHSFVSEPISLPSRSVRRDFPNSVLRKDKYFLNKDNLYIYWHVWEPEGECKGVVVIVHGLNEHCNRYEHLAVDYNAKGYKVYALDHQGHGMSEGDRLFVAHFTDYIDDVVYVIKKAKHENPSKKLILLGHSMGGLIAVLTSMRVQDILDAGIYSAPALYNDDAPSWSIPFLHLLASFIPKLRLMGLDISTICNDKAVVDMYLNDPLVTKLFPTLRLQSEIIKGMTHANKNFQVLKLPMLILQGDADKLCPMRGSAKMSAEVSSEDKTYNIYPGHFHELFNEDEKVVQDSLGFLDRICKD